VYLLDTNVVSELRRRRPHGAVLAWVGAVPAADLYVSAVTLGELQAGIELTRERDLGKAAELEAWLDDLPAQMNVLSVDERAFRIWARLMHRTSIDLFEDAMIAAVALVNGLTVATRNERDFRRFDVKLFNPFGAAR